MCTLIKSLQYLNGYADDYVIVADHELGSNHLRQTAGSQGLELPRDGDPSSPALRAWSPLRNTASQRKHSPRRYIQAYTNITLQGEIRFLISYAISWDAVSMHSTAASGN